MLYRIKQFYRGLKAKVTPEDLQFLRSYLTAEETALFRRLRISEQRHCLNIAYDCLAEKEHSPLLIKAALLHDVGKTKSNLTLVNKALAVLVKKLRIPGKILPVFLTKALYYKEQHPVIGAEILQRLGTEAPVIFLTRYHHRDLTRKPFRDGEYSAWVTVLPAERNCPDQSALSPDDTAELVLLLKTLQEIDEKN